MRGSPALSGADGWIAAASRHGNLDRSDPGRTSTRPRLGRRSRSSDGEPEAGSDADLPDPDLVEADLRQGRVVEEPKSGAQHNRHYVDPELVHETGGEQLPDDADAPTTVTAFWAAAAFARATADSTPSVTNVNVRRSFSFGVTGGGWWVSTKIGVWNSRLRDRVGVLGHLERPPPHDDCAGLL